ncbi:hypothetical protein CDL15_Pgr019645 [Punica granatum]|uniref:Uncharacterized protein n=1 Tax=Punica granatum TaxID=22663 RepID=A0A218X550_PUNGR|nr:hypothetical protein CDL15_Pgr019645 [Punica granatum]
MKYIASQTNQLSRKEDWYCTRTRRSTISAATPHGEPPSDDGGIQWWLLRRRSHPRKLSGLSMEESHWTRRRSTTGVASRSHPISSSAVSTADSKLKYHDVPRNTKATARITRTGHGSGLRVKPSEIAAAVGDLLWL